MGDRRRGETSIGRTRRARIRVRGSARACARGRIGNPHARARVKGVRRCRVRGEPDLEVACLQGSRVSTAHGSGERDADDAGPGRPAAAGDAALR